MEEHFEVVVVGSGFGGSVVTYRLAEAGKSVCLLERGKAYGPGDFARTPYEMRHNFWRPGKGAHGLFDVWSFRHIEAVVAAGLGGGSLIYANVLLRKDAAWFERGGLGGERWPISRSDLDPHYDAVEAILRPEIYPDEYQFDNKTSAMHAAALQLGYAVTTHDHIEPQRPQWFLPPLAIRFRDTAGRARPGQPLPDEGANYHGKLRETCRLCGECDVGCNYGAKNTLDHTYISLAWGHGAQIRTLVEVDSIEPLRRGGRLVYRLVYTRHHGGNVPRERGSMTATRVVLACGTLGTVLLLMRSRKRLPKLSKRLGERFSGNGDYLAFVKRATRGDPEHLVGRPLNASRAPVITSTFRFPDALDGVPSGARGAYLQDAGYPLVCDYFWELTAPFAVIRRFARFVLGRVIAAWQRDPQTEIGRSVAATFGSAHLSRDTMPLLGMGRDVPNGRLRLRKNRLRLSWDDRPSRAFYERLDREARRVAVAMGGHYFQNPISRTFNRMITVHPLGGCAIGANEREGVVDEWGEVFNYPRLYVADGSLMPGPVGPNPSLTIAALADRVADHMLKTWDR